MIIFAASFYLLDVTSIVFGSIWHVRIWYINSWIKPSKCYYRVKKHRFLPANFSIIIMQLSIIMLQDNNYLHPKFWLGSTVHVKFLSVTCSFFSSHICRGLWMSKDLCAVILSFCHSGESSQRGLSSQLVRYSQWGIQTSKLLGLVDNLQSPQTGNSKVFCLNN